MLTENAKQRITTKYSFPSQRPTALKKAQARQSQRQQRQQQQTQDASTTQLTTQPPVATLTLKTYNPSAGICLQYRTNKAAEVGRLITSLGKLAGGADVAALGLGAAAATAGAAAGGDVEMTDAPVATEEGAPAPAQAAGQAQGKAEGAKGGKSKKKGKGKR